MSRRSKRAIQVLNPPPGGTPFTTRRGAQRLVDRGRARWKDSYAIELEAHAAIPAIPAAAARHRETHSPCIFVSKWHRLLPSDPGPDVHQVYPPWPTYDGLRETAKNMKAA